jgi:hypothetical protein
MMEQMGGSDSRLILMNTKNEEIIVDPTKMDVTKFANLERYASHLPVIIPFPRPFRVHCTCGGSGLCDDVFSSCAAGRT